MSPIDLLAPPSRFDNSYARDLEGFFVDWEAAKAPSPELVQFNAALAADLGLDTSQLAESEIASIFAGNAPLNGARPIAQVYAGHQFGGFTPQLGDGRALLLGEVIAPNGRRFDIQLKGSGRTPFSRSGDGKAALGPVLREYLIAEAMHALGVPTTRALAAVTTGDRVIRDAILPGAVLTRVAESHIRVGTFQFFAARGEIEKIRQLADYAIARHDPDIKDGEAPYLAFFRAVLQRQASLIAQWMCLGFVHGVMNTDNTTISGETIDYGPCAFIDAYRSDAVFSSIDHGGRYAFANQPVIGQWNLARLAETLLPLVSSDREEAKQLLTQELDTYLARFMAAWLDGMRAKLGLTTAHEGDTDLANALLRAMEDGGADFTLTFRRLSDAIEGDAQELRALFSNPDAIDSWLAQWRSRLAQEPLDASARAAGMRRVNPIYVPRNHRVEEALSAAGRGDLDPFRKLLAVITNPFDEDPGLADYATPAPADFGPYQTFCGT